jgi:hypothetical protein
MRRVIWSFVLGFGFLPAIILAQDFEAIPAELGQQLANRLSEDAARIEKLKFRVDADGEKANGFHIPQKTGALVVPQKELKESEELSAKFKMDPGAALAYLFIYHLVPVVDGKRVEANQLPSVSFTDDDGGKHEVHVLCLSVRQLSEDDYRLYAFGQDAKPLVDAKFSEGTGPGPVPVAVELKEPNKETRQGKLVVTVFGKYQASFPVGYTGE